MPNVGDRIVGQWEPEWFYPGVVVAGASGMFTIQFDDGGRAELRTDQIKPLSIEVGNRVYSRWKGGTTYYPGRVSGVNGHAISVDYDDGDKEATSVSMFRQHVSDLG